MTDWGSVPDWVGAVGGVAVLAAAFETLRRDRKRVAQLEGDRVEQARQASRDRISTMAVWPEDWSSHDVRVICRNAGSEPVFDVVVRADCQEPHACPTPGDAGDARMLFLMRPGEELETTLRLSGTITTRPYVDMSFRDPAGDRWWRRCDGVLCSVTESGQVIWPC